MGNLLAADIGGTKTDIAYGLMRDGKLAIERRHKYPSQEYETLEAIVDDFAALLDGGVAALRGCSACFAVAGPVAGDTAKLTNLTWRIDGPALTARYGFRAARIINDFAGIGYGLSHLQPDELLPLQAGTAEPRGARVVVGAGTGLGVALLWHDGASYVVHPTEAGHVDFAPTDGVEDGLLAELRHEFGRVSYERVLSGGGLVHVFRFLMASGYGLPSSALEAALGREDPASEISHFGLEGRDPLAACALDIFAKAYGAFAGNMALTVLARGGVYVAGGIAPKIAAKLRQGGFMEAFLDKGRFRAVLSAMPVHIVMNPGVGLYGALEVAHRAAATAGAGPGAAS